MDRSGGHDPPAQGRRLTAPGWRVILACLCLSIAVSAPATGSEPVLVDRDVVYTDEPVALTLDVYRTAAPDPLPSLILVHGGSWRRGDKSDWQRLARRFAQEGFAAFAIEYRLAPPGGEALFPAPVDDLARALAWVRDNAAAYGGDADSIGVVGASAGAHIALLEAGARDPAPDAVALFSPPVVLRRLYARGILRPAIETFIGCRPLACPQSYRAASGLAAVDGDMPPTLLMYSSRELIPARQLRALDDRLSRAEVPHRTIERRGTAHALRLAPKLFSSTVRFLHRKL